MKKLILLLIFIILSCAKDTQRVAMECYVYDSTTKKPVEDVEITQQLDGENVIVAKTSAKGYFKVTRSTKLSFGMETHNLANLFFLKKNGYLTDTIETSGGANDLYKQDSIFLRKL
ncbi:hypothetical protein A0O34_04835 [Chryseobacterium glaciei]|uniref:Uncharacterized protein n=1 Tax=Chryseobacterium glaciei TaxID=1685010 RepID=A0A172XSH4_9FLAO|nr:hypothetical protein [Chryseobacterium glaciei]ANF49894.1 hypothetical protein A0O34_04835 [Chryseobacterium glaciei]